MPSPSRIGPAAALALAIIAIVSGAGGVTRAADQAAAPAQAAPVTAAQAAPFLGDWTIEAVSQMGPASFSLSVTGEPDGVRARIRSADQPETAIRDIRMSAQSLVLRYAFDYQGSSVPTVVVLTPRGSGLRVDFSMMDGQFEMSGTGTRPGSAPASAQATGAGRGEPAAAPQPAVAARRPQPQVAKVTDLMQMMAALPDTPPAVPKQPRRVLALARAAGFVHASIPLAARTVEALGQKTGAWSTVITYDPADVNADNLSQYDAIFLVSTTGLFLDDASDAKVSTARRKALLDFVRGGKGLAAIHAATDSYHGAADTASPRPATATSPRPVDGGSPLWPEFNTLIGGYFKYHWNYPTQVVVKIEDPTNPINAPFTSVNAQTNVRLARPFAIADEIYTFNQDSWSRENAHVLTSVDYSKMPAEVKAQEPAPQRADHDYVLSYIRREGQGRVFVEILGHDESIYKVPAMLAHILAGVQYALGDLQADDTPSARITSR